MDCLWSMNQMDATFSPWFSILCFKYDDLPYISRWFTIPFENTAEAIQKVPSQTLLRIGDSGCSETLLWAVRSPLTCREGPSPSAFCFQTTSPFQMTASSQHRDVGALSHDEEARPLSSMGRSVKTTGGGGGPAPRKVSISLPSETELVTLCTDQPVPASQHQSFKALFTHSGLSMNVLMRLAYLLHYKTDACFMYGQSKVEFKGRPRRLHDQGRWAGRLPGCQEEGAALLIAHTHANALVYPDNEDHPRTHLDRCSTVYITNSSVDAVSKVGMLPG